MQGFSQWQQMVGKQAFGLPDDSIVFLHEDFTLTTSATNGNNVILDTKTSEWENYCKDVLKFVVPNWHQELATVLQNIEVEHGTS